MVNFETLIRQIHLIIWQVLIRRTCTTIYLQSGMGLLSDHPVDH